MKMLLDLYTKLCCQRNNLIIEKKAIILLFQLHDRHCSLILYTKKITIATLQILQKA